MNQHTLYDIAFTFEENISPIEKVLLREQYRSTEVIYQNNGAYCRTIGKHIKLKTCSIEKAKYMMEFMARSSIHTIRYDEKEYPFLLSQIPDKPFMLYVRGNVELLSKKSVAIVGTRKPDRNALQITDEITQILVSTGFSVTSGLAAGIDSHSHKTAINHNGTTIGVLGSGIDIIYPCISKSLARQMLMENNLIISEYPPTIPPYKHHFPMRNRIIAGLSEFTVLMQAPEKSGSIITARLAIEYNRDLAVYMPQGAAPHYKGNFDVVMNHGGATFANADNFAELIKYEMPAISRHS